MGTLKPFPAVALLPLAILTLVNCGGDGGGSDTPPTPEPDAVTREHDDRAFRAAEEISFAPLSEELAYPPSPPTDVYYGTYQGLQGDAVYSFEAPQDWDGNGLIMYTHGFRGEGEVLDVSIPPLPWRLAVLSAGYAWAASSYSPNFYDARAGLEDTNKLALEITDYLETDWGVSFDAPSQYLISGVSMGGHIAAAAVDSENIDTTMFPVPYAGSAPFCQAEENQFQWLGDYPRAMMEIAGYGDRDYSEFQTLLGDYDDSGSVIIQAGEMLAALFEINENGTPNWANPINENGENLVEITKNLSGGERPIFDEGFNSFWNDVSLSTGGADGTVTGILAGTIYDNQDTEYRWTTGDITTAEQEFNDSINRVSASDGVNALREDGVRWIPLVEGDFNVPVLTMHTLGDMFVPFVHQQLYQQKARDNGNEDLLVQRAIRATGHCAFSFSEIVTAMTDFLTWVNADIKPAGDEVLDAEVVANEDYGCTFTNTSPDVAEARASLPACSM